MGVHLSEVLFIDFTQSCTGVMGRHDRSQSYVCVIGFENRFHFLHQVLNCNNYNNMYGVGNWFD